MAEFYKGPFRKIKIAEYEIQHTIGKGPISRIRFGINKVTKKFYAMKIWKKKEIIENDLLEQIKNECKILAYVENNLIAKFDGIYNQDDKYFILSMEFVAGGDLFSYLKDCVTLPLDHAVFYAGQIFLMLEWLHSKSIIYRDLKPENLLIDNKTGYLKLADFGISKYCEGRTFTICGTPGYIAPEMIQGKGYGKSVDWWQMGVVFYEMLVGILPFIDEDPIKICEKILKQRVLFPSTIDKSAKNLIKHLLEKDPNKRFGCTKNGINDIKGHRVFQNIDFNLLKSAKVKANYIPGCGNGDVKMYPKFDDSILPVTAVNADEDPFQKW